MKTTLQKISAISAIVFCFFSLWLPQVFALTPSTPTPTPTPSTPTPTPTPSTPPVKVSLDNYLSVDTIQDLLVAILNIVMILMVPIIVFFIILAGFKYVTARGNASQVEEATRALTYAIIGGVLVLGAVALSEIIKNVVDQF